MADLTLNFRGEQVDVIKNIDLILKKLTAMDKKLDQTDKQGEKTTKKLGNAFTRMSARITRAITGMAGKLTALLGAGGLVAVFVKATKAAKTFETGLAEVGTLLGEAANRLIPEYRKSILELSKTSNATANQLTKGLYQVISAGTKGTEEAAGAMKLLTIANRASVGGVSDTFTAVDLLTTSLNAYGVGVEKATEFSDQIFTTIKLGKINFDELAAGMGTIASSAAGAKISFAEVNAALATMTAAGIPARRAFTAYNAIVRVAAKGTKELDEALGETSSNVLRREGFIGVMERIRDITKGDTIALQKLKIEQEAITGLAVLAGTGLDKFRDSLDQTKDSAGNAEAAYKIMADTFDFKSKKFFNQINVILIKIGTKLLPVFARKMEQVGKWMEENGDKIVLFFQNLFEAIQSLFAYIADNGKKIAVIFAALWAAGPIGNFITLIGSAKKAMIGFMAAAGPLAGVVTALAAIVALEPSIGGLLEEADKIVANRIKLLEAAADAARLTKLPQAFTQKFIGKDEGEAGPVGQTAAQKEAAIKWAKARKTALLMLQRLELTQLDKVARIRKQLEIDIGKIRNVQGINNAEKDRAIEIKKLEAAKKIKGIEEKIEREWQKERDAIEKKNIKERAEIKKKLESEKGMLEFFDASALDEFNNSMQPLLDENEKRRMKFFTEEAPEGFVKGVARGFKEKIGATLFDIMGQAGGLLVSPFRKIIDLIMQFVQAGDVEGAQAILQNFLNFMDNLSQNLGMILEWIIQEGLPKIIDSMVENIPIILDAILDNLPRLVQDLIRSIPRIVNAFIEKLPKIISTIIELIPIIINEIIRAIPQIIFAFVKQIPMIAWEMAKAVVKAIFSLMTMGLGKKGKGKGGSTLPGIEGLEGLDGTTEGRSAEEIERIKKNREAYLEALRKQKTTVPNSDTSLITNPPNANRFHDGGMIDGMIRLGKAIKAHTGMFVGGLRGDEVPIIAQVGESVLNRQATADIGGRAGVDARNNGESPSGGDIHYHMEWRPQYAFVEDSANVIDQMQSELIKKRGGQMQNVVGANNSYRSRRG